MPRLRITHITEHSDRRPVGPSCHWLQARPQGSHDLRLHDATLAADPAPSAVAWAPEVFGHSICLLDWPAALRTETLRIVSPPALTLDPMAESFPFSHAAGTIPDVSRLTERPYPDAAGQVAGEGAVATLSVLAAMTQAIREEFTHLVREAGGTLTLGSGTCRDFALLMMEAARSLGLAARLVTGYLYGSAVTGDQGGGASHAWCAVCLPGAGWVECDPTNGLVAGANLIRVSMSRAPEQALPVAGVYLGAPDNTLACWSAWVCCSWRMRPYPRRLETWPAPAVRRKGTTRWRG